MSDRAGSNVRKRVRGAVAAAAAVAAVAWLGWYGYEDGRATTRGLQVVGLLRDAQSCIGLSYEVFGRQNGFAGPDFAYVTRMKSTPYAGRFEWDALGKRATATFADVHRDYDGRTLWTEANVRPDGSLRWGCGTTVGSGSRSYANIARFIERCDRPLEVSPGLIEYCRGFVPLPPQN